MNQSIYTGFASSLSNSTAMDMVGDNIANINTTGFKGSYAEFATLFEGYLNTAANNPVTSNTGNGMRVSSSSLDMRQGSYQSTDSTFNMAIQGQGWFGVINDNIYNANDISFTRDGTFTQNRDGYLVNGNENYLLGSDYGLIATDADGNYVIDTTATAIAPSTTVGDQSALFAPKNLTYPHITTNSATLQKNLYSESATHKAAASYDTGIPALLTSDGNLMAMQTNQDLLMSVGTDAATYDAGKISFSFAAGDDTASADNTAAFTLNGTQITATWNEGDSAAVVAASIQDAINAAGISNVSATLSNNTVTISAEESLSIAGSTYPALSPVYIADIRYDETASGSTNTFSTLDTLKTQVEAGIASVYGSNSADVFINAKGQLEVAAKSDTILMDFQSAADTNSDFLNTMNALNGTIVQDTVATSQAFNVASTTSSQKIIDENGEEKLLYVTMTQTSPKTAASGAVWQADATIVSTEGATELTNAAELLSNGDPVGLKENQDMWLSMGNGDIRKTTFGYDYALAAPEDIADGTDSSLSFFVNGTAVDVTITDGSTPNESATLIVTALQALGIDASANSGEVLIHADTDTPTLTITGGTSSVDNYSIPSHTLQYAAYGLSGSSSFTTLEDLVSMIDSGTQAAGLTLDTTITNSKLQLQNTGTEDVAFRILGGMDSNTKLVNLLNPTYDPITAGSTVTTSQLDTHTVIDSASQTLSFDTTSQLADGTVITLQNGTEDLVLDLSNLTNYNESIYNEYFTQNGESEGSFSSYDIDQNGRIIANFSNGQNVAVAEVNLYHFQNEQGLEKVGGNQFVESSNSGDAFFYTDEEGQLVNGGTIRNKTLETSNVSTASALTEMIVLQRAFEGSAKIITTSDELLKNAIAMKK